MPRYQSVKDAAPGLQSTGKKVQVPIGDEVQTGTLHTHPNNEGPPTYFIEHIGYFDRGGYYGDGYEDYPDNAERFIFFCRAILEACKSLEFKPDIIHCSDWQTGLVPVFLKVLYGSNPFFSGTRTLFSLHNLGFQGNFSKDNLPLAHLPWDLFTPEGVEFYGSFSFLKGGLVFADLLNTVSKTYSREIQTPEHGFQMDGVLRYRKNDLFGVPNGIDIDQWNPAQDKYIETHFSSKSLKGKADCKQALIKRFGLPLKNRTPLIGMVTRLSSQKGVDLVIQGFQDIMRENAGMVILGSGDPDSEKFFREQQQKHKGSFACHIGFDEELAHQIIAGCDYLLMPSAYEPSGLTQMYALRYGTVPVVRAVGGLKDTVQVYRPKTGKGTGFLFKPYELKYLLNTLRQALSYYRKPVHWRRLILNGMAQDNGWQKAAQQYIRLYRKALRKS